MKSRRQPLHIFMELWIRRNITVLAVTKLNSSKWSMLFSLITCLPGYFSQLHLVHWAAPYCGFPSALEDSAWDAIWETDAVLLARCSSGKKRANHHMGLLLGLQCHPLPFLLFLHSLHYLDPQKGGRTGTGNLGQQNLEARTQGKGRWQRALLVVMTSSVGGLNEEGVRTWCTDRPEISCRQAKTIRIDSEIRQAALMLVTLCF